MKRCGSCRHWGQPIGDPPSGVTLDYAAPKLPRLAVCSRSLAWVSRYGKCGEWAE